MGKNNIIRKYQTARLDEWIGDYISADLVYDEIQRSDDELSRIIKSTIKQRKEKLPVEKIENTKTDFVECLVPVSMMQIDNRTKLLYQLESLQLRKPYITQIQHDLLKWKYSISIISKVDGDLRLEIRGYNPEGHPPKLNIELSKQMINWEIASNMQFSGTETPLLEINAYNKDENTIMYLSIDEWGLLLGSIIVNEKYLGDILISIDIFLSSLSNNLW